MGALLDAYVSTILGVPFLSSSALSLSLYKLDTTDYSPFLKFTFFGSGILHLSDFTPLPFLVLLPLPVP